MTQELNRELKRISQSFYEWLQKAIIENWREPIEEPIDTFCHYDDKEGAELAQMYSEHAEDEKTIAEIDSYLSRVVEAVNNGTSVEYRGGKRPNSGRKTKDASGKAVTVSFCCSPEQKEQLQKAVAESGMKQSEWILSRLL